jgi:acid stress-induced BolA-like protein IbaG/YrbA
MIRIKKVLEKELHPQDIKLSRPRGGRIYGWVISEAFEGVSTVDRFQKIWQPLDRQLSSKDHAQISALFGITPKEQIKLFEKRPRPRATNHPSSARELARLMMRVRKTLAQEFSPRTIELKPTPFGKITGWVTSDSFDGQSEFERMQRIFKLLNEHLSSKDREQVSVIWPITRLERRVLLEDKE